MKVVEKMGNIKIKVELQLDDKYKKIPDGYILESMTDDYGIVQSIENRHGKYRLINSEGEFVTGEYDSINQFGNNSYILCLNGSYSEREFEIIEDGKVINKLSDFDNLEHLGEDLFKGTKQAINSYCYYVVDKYGNVLLDNVINPVYYDGKIIYQNKNRDKFYITSRDNKIIDSFEVGFKCSPVIYKNGNCLVETSDCKMYGVNLKDKKVINMDTYSYLVEYDKENYNDYYLIIKNDYEMILDSNFNVLKDDISQGHVTGVCDGVYFCLDNDFYYVIDFDNNIRYKYDRHENNNIINICDSKFFDCLNKEEISIPKKWIIYTDTNRNELFECRDNYGSNRLTDFSSIDILLDSVVLGNKYVVINNVIVPIADLKTLDTNYKLIVESDGEVFTREFDNLRKLSKTRKKLNKNIDLLEKEKDCKKKEIEEKHDAKIKKLIMTKMKKKDE